VRDYLLFVDTETSGLPKNWDIPYDQDEHWPHIVQVAWLVYTKSGKFVKESTFYIQATNFEISPASYNVHGLDKSFLLKHGLSRQEVMQKLQEDLDHYQPLVVGHYVKLDYHMLGVSFYRCGLSNPLPSLPTFCTMKATEDYIRYPFRRYLGLGELYKRLFQKTLQQQHHALSDARATADCFFAMLKKGSISEESIQLQQSRSQTVSAADLTSRHTFLYIILMLLFLLTLIFFQL